MRLELLQKAEKKKQRQVNKMSELKSKNIYAVTMENGDVYGVPAELIADDYAKHYASLGEDYQENYNAMMHWFETDDYEFADWAKGSMDWDDVKDKAVLLKEEMPIVDFQEGWVNGEYEYRHY